ncbi:hypothetical protein Tco_0672102 [Tanacetum coccineum]
MQALKESRKTSKRQPGTGGSNEETGTIPGVPDKFTVISATSSEETEDDQLDDKEKDDKDDDADDEGDDHISDVKDTDDEDDETEYDEDEIYKYCIHKDEDEEMSNAEVEDSDKGDEEPSVLTPVQESPSMATITTLPPPSISTTQPAPLAILESDALSAVQLRVAKLEKDVSELKKIDLSAEALAALKTQAPFVVDNYLGSKVGDVPKNQTPTVDLEQESRKSPLEILKIKKEQAEKKKMPKFTIKYTEKAALKEYDQKSSLYQTMHANKSFNKNPTNH